MKKQKYDLGSFVKANQSGIGSAAGLGAGLLGNFQSDTTVDTGLDIGQGVLSGVGAGAAFGPIGMGVGALVGGISGLISSGAKRRKLEGIRKANIANYDNSVVANMTTTNPNMYGNSYEDGGNIQPDPPLSNKFKTEWNNFISYMQSSGQAGNKNLDVRNKSLGIDLLNNYIKANKTTQLSPDSIQRVQRELNNYRNATWKAAEFPNKQDYMPNLSQTDGWLGSKTSQAKFPKHFHNGVDVGFAKFENGGMVNTEQNKINIEQGELLINPDTGKVLQEFNGINPLTGGKYQPHAKKGKDTKHNFTYADPGLFVINVKNAKKYQDAIKSNDKLSQKTILMNIQNNKISENGGLEKMADGGNIKPNILNNLGSIIQGNSLGNYFSNPALSATKPVFNTNMSLNLPSSISAPNVLSTAKQGFNWGNALDGIANYGVPALNIARGLFDKPATQSYTTAITNPYKNQILNNLPSNIDISPMINQVRQGERGAVQDLRNSVNNSAVYRANRQQIAANSTNQINNLQLQQQLNNNSIAQQRAAIYGNLGAQDMQEQSRVRDYNLNIDMMNNQARGNQQNILNTGLSQLQQVYQNNKANNRKQQMDKYSLDILGQIYPLTKYYNVFDSNYLK